jgi:hypothetical protein
VLLLPLIGGVSLYSVSVSTPMGLAVPTSVRWFVAVSSGQILALLSIASLNLRSSNAPVLAAEPSSPIDGAPMVSLPNSPMNTHVIQQSDLRSVGCGQASMHD